MSAAMSHIEQYAVSLVHEGAAHCAQDDMGEEAEHLTEKQWREACDLGIRMAIAIVNNRESFLAWYRQIEGGQPCSARKGYETAIAVLRDVAERTGSPAAAWCADYLLVDPDRLAPPPQ